MSKQRLRWFTHDGAAYPSCAECFTFTSSPLVAEAIASTSIENPTIDKPGVLVGLAEQYHDSGHRLDG